MDAPPEAAAPGNARPGRLTALLAGLGSLLVHAIAFAAVLLTAVVAPLVPEEQAGEVVSVIMLGDFRTSIKGHPVSRARNRKCSRRQWSPRRFSRKASRNRPWWTPSRRCSRFDRCARSNPAGRARNRRLDRTGSADVKCTGGNRSSAADGYRNGDADRDFDCRGLPRRRKLSRRR